MVKINGGNFYFVEIVGLIFLGREKFEGKRVGSGFTNPCLTACVRWVPVLKKLGTGVCEFGR